MSHSTWQLQEAKNRFSEVVNKALDEGPQTVTRHGVEIVVILSKEEYNRLVKSQTSLLDFFRQSPLVDVELELDRDQSLPPEYRLVNYILDTIVISELVAARPNPKVIHWIQSVDSDQVFLSVIAIGELKKGIEKLRDSDRKSALNHWLDEDLLVRFGNHLLIIDQQTMLIWGKLIARLESIGRPISAIDSLLAATTLRWQYTFVTRNTVNFEWTGIALLNPWE